MGELSILVWNAGGLNTPHKRSSVLSLLRRQKVDIALIQETHLLNPDSKHLANRFYHVVASSSVNTKARGVVVVARRNLPIKVLDIRTENVGRMVIVKVEIYGWKNALASVYAPNKFEEDFYDPLTRYMLELTEYSIIVGADMNAVGDVSLDRSHSRASRDQELATAALRSWAQSLGLIHVWQSMNPTLKDISFFSHRHKTFSRIDFLFSSPNLFQRIYTATLLPIALSDHKGVFCRATLKCLSKRGTRWRLNSSLLKNGDFKAQFLTGLDEFLSFNVGSVDHPRILWDAVKGFIRSNAILFSSNLQKVKSSRLQSLDSEFSRLDFLLQNNYSLEIETKHDLVKKKRLMTS